LHSRAMTLLTGGSEFVRAEKEQREMLMKEVRSLLPDTLTEEELLSHFNTLPARYFQIHLAKEIVDDIELVHHFIRQQVFAEEGTLSPIIKWQDEPDRGYNLVRICTWDRAGLFGKIAGTFSAAGLNILSAQIFTRGDGIVLDEFFVNDAKTGNLATREQHEKFDQLLDDGLNGRAVDLPALIARQKESHPAYEAYAGERMPTQIHLDNEASETRTQIEIETEDRLGLLYAISRSFAELTLDISAARIVTERGAAIDSFYVSEHDGGKIISPERQSLIAQRLREAIGRLESVA
jgi:[protein-PII] uridylyltransferase